MPEGRGRDRSRRAVRPASKRPPLVRRHRARSIRRSRASVTSRTGNQMRKPRRKPIGSQRPIRKWTCRTMRSRRSSRRRGRRGSALMRRRSSDGCISVARTTHTRSSGWSAPPKRRRRRLMPAARCYTIREGARDGGGAVAGARRVRRARVRIRRLSRRGRPDRAVVQSPGSRLIPVQAAPFRRPPARNRFAPDADPMVGLLGAELLVNGRRC